MGLKTTCLVFVAGIVLGLVIGPVVLAPSSGGTSHTITTAGSTTVFPLSQEWATHFHDDHPTFTVSPNTGGSGLGQSQVAAGLVDIGASSSYPEPAYWENNPHVKILPVCADGVAVVANPAVNGTVLRLDCDMVVAMFQREVTTWEEFESTFGVEIQQTGPINVYVRSDASGTTSTFARWLETADENTNPNGAEYEWTLGHHESVSWPEGVNSVDGNPGVALGVADDQNGIGYVGLAFMEGLTTAQLYNPSSGEWVSPSVQNVLNAVPEEMSDPGVDLMNAPAHDAYPIARFLYYLVNSDHLRWPVLVFLEWVLVRGQVYVPDVGYVPITGSSAMTYAQQVVSSLSPTE